MLIGAVVTFLLGASRLENARSATASLAYVYGAATGFWSVDWIVLLGRGSVQHADDDRRLRDVPALAHPAGTLDVRVQTMLFAWAFGALLEGLVGFGYPWAFVAPILITLGLSDLDAIRVAAIANNAPVSYGALGAPIIAIAQ